MKKKVVFRCQFGGNRYVTYEETCDWGFKGTVYVNYVNRKKMGVGSWKTLAGAIGHIMVYLDGFKFEDFKNIWIWDVTN